MVPSSPHMAAFLDLAKLCLGIICVPLHRLFLDLLRRKLLSKWMFFVLLYELASMCVPRAVDVGVCPRTGDVGVSGGVLRAPLCLHASACSSMGVCVCAGKRRGGDREWPACWLADTLWVCGAGGFGADGWAPPFLRTFCTCSSCMKQAWCHAVLQPVLKRPGAGARIDLRWKASCPPPRPSLGSCRRGQLCSWTGLCILSCCCRH